LLGLRSIPNHVVIRPADPHETVAAWRVAINHRHGPVSLVLSRQKLPPLNINDIEKTTVGVEAGAYVLSHGEENTKPEIILVATGSEVHLALSAQEKLGKKGIPSYVISMPSWNLFQNQPDEYRNLILPPDIPVLAIEAGVSLGWKTYLQSDLHVMSVDRFGASAPGEIVMDKYGFNVDHILQKVESILELDHE
jgi:transketolase